MNEQEIKSEVVKVQEEFSQIRVANKADMNIASAKVFELDKMANKIKEYWSEPKKKAHEAHKAITAKEKEMLEPILNLKSEIVKMIDSFLRIEEQKRREEQARLDAERRKKEEAERLKLEKKAVKAEEKGNVEKAEELREKAEDVYIPPAIIEPAEKTVKTDNGSITARRVKKIEVLDLMDVIKGIAAGTIPLTVIELKEQNLLKWMDACGLKEAPGCRLYDDVQSSFRRV